MGKLFNRLKILFVGASRRDGVHDIMLGDKGRRRDDPETTLFEEIPQLEQGVVVVAVSVDGDDHRRSFVSVEVLQALCRRCRYASAVDRHAGQQQLVR